MCDNKNKHSGGYHVMLAVLLFDIGFIIIDILIKWDEMFWTKCALKYSWKF